MRDTRKSVSLLLLVSLLLGIVTPASAAGAAETSDSSKEAVQAAVAQEDLVLHYSFDETSGTTVRDASGNNRSGTMHGGASFSDGKVNNALTLNGSNGYIQMPDGILQNVNAMTVSAWVKPGANPAWSRVFDFGSSTTSNLFLTLNNGANGTIRLGMVNGSTSHDIDAVEFPSSDAWQHVAVTMAGKVAVIYLNGIEVAQNSNITIKPSDLGNSTRNYIGRSQWPDPYFNGKIDDFRVYNRALSGEDLKEVMAESLTVLESVALDKNWLSLGDSTELLSDIELPAAGPMGSSITWHSSDPAVISHTGRVTRPAAGSGDAEVTLTASLSKGEVFDTKVFEFVVWETGSAAYQIDIDAGSPLYESNPTLFGLFYEDINYAADGGLYAELIQNRSFEFSSSLASWSTEAYGGAAVTVTSSTAQPLNENNHKYARIQITEPGEGAGISNFGYTGIAVEGGERYDFSIYARTKDSLASPMRVELRSEDESVVYGSADITGLTAEWTKFEAKLVSNTTDNKAKLVILFDDAAAVDVDMISLFPEKTWKNRENGLRYDLAKMLDDMNPKFLRFPGGCIVENGAIDNIYRWKNTIGDVAERETQTNFWGYHQSFGLGYDEYFRLAEDIGAEPVPHIFSGIISCNSNPPTVPMDQLQPYIDDALDLIEYANGDAETTEWGAVRAANGHPEPYNLKYLGIGNETWGANYFSRYKVFYDAIKAKYPDIRLILSAGAFPEDANYRATYEWLGKPGDGQEADLVDEHMYQSPAWMLNNVDRYDDQDRSGPSVFVGEFASHGSGRRNNVESAITEAAFMTGLERNSDIVEMAAYAPLFSRRPASFTQWTPDMIWFDEHKAFGTPNYYVQKEFMNHMGDQVLLVNLTKKRGSQVEDKDSIMLGTWATQVEYDNISVVAEDGTVLYQNDFSDPSTLADFTDNGAGGWVIADGVLKQTSMDEDVRLRLNGEDDWPDYTMTLEAKKTAGNEGFLIGFEAEDFDNYYWYNLGGWNNTVTVVERSVNNAKSDASPRLSQGVKTGQTYKITIGVEQDMMRLYLDDKLMFEVKPDQQKNDNYIGPLYSSTTVDKETGDIIVKVVNTSSNRQPSNIQVSGADYINPEGTVIEISGDSLTAENSFEKPADTASVTRTHSGFGASFAYEFPSYSVTILRLKTTEGPVVEAIDPIEAITAVNQPPQLPSTVTLHLSDNTTAKASVQWKPIDDLQYNNPGVFEVEGIVEGTYLEAEAAVTVLEADVSGQLMKAYADLKIPNEDNVRGNITLKSEMAAGAETVQITWHSSHPEIISDEAGGDQGQIPAGVVRRQAEDANVTLTAALRLNGQTLHKTFHLTVKAAAQLDEFRGYMYTYFRSNLYGTGESQQIHLATSKDGLFWDDMNNNEPILVSTLGTKGVRDSYVVRAPEGDKFYMIATDLDANGGNWGQYANNGSKSIMVWESDDLVNWSDQRMIEIAPEGAGNMWAPETIYDPSTGEYVVYWASNVKGEGHRIYYAKTRDFRSFTKPQVFKDRTAADTFIDTSMIAHDGMYYRFTKNEDNLTILLEKSPSVLGQYELVKEKIAGQEGVEGPGIFKLNGEDKWLLLMDGYTRSNAGVGFFPLIAESPDDLASGNFRRLESHEFRMPTGAKHGSIIPVTGQEYDAIMEKWGGALVEPVTPDTGDPVVPDLEYKFDEALDGTAVLNTGKSGAQNNGTLYNGAGYADDAGKGEVLKLGGGAVNTDSPYLEFPQGYFDGKDNVTIMMDVKSEMNNENFFTFTAGQDRNKYLFLRTRPNEIYSALTVKTYSKEQGITKPLASSMKNTWTNLAIVLERNPDGKYSTMKLYRDGVLVGTQNQLVANLSTMGSGLKAYLGKSFYPDTYFKGSFDHVRVYNRALTDVQIMEVIQPPGGDDDLILHYDMKTTAEADGRFIVKDVAKGTVTYDGIFRNRGNGGHASDGTSGFVSFNGGGSNSNSGYIEIPKGSDGHDVLHGLDEVTVSTIVNWTNDGVNRWIFGLGTVLTPETNKYLFATPRHGVSGNPAAAGISKQGWPNEALVKGAAGSSMAPGTWHHVTVTMSEAANTLTLYLNGAKVASGSANGIKLSDLIDSKASHSGFLGKSIFTGDSYLRGSIADFRIYKRALTGEEVTKLYTEASDSVANIRQLTVRDAAKQLDMSRYLGEGDSSAAEITQNLTLPVSGNNGVRIAWSSSHPDVISSSGKVTRPAADAADIEVELTATLTYQDMTETVRFPVTVLKDFDDQQKADQDAAALMIYNANNVKGNLRLAATGPAGSKITWASSKPEVIKGTAEAAGDAKQLGWVTRQAADQAVTLTATVTHGAASAERSFEVTVAKAPKAPDYDAYFFAYFTGEYEGGEEISFATAEDPLYWRALNNGKSVIQSTMGEKGLRDPFIIRSPEGDKFYLIATDLKMGESTNFDQAQITGSHSIMVWESEDLVNWSEQRMVEVAPKNGGNTWAPEAYYDPNTGEYVVFWASSMKAADTYGKYPNGRPSGQYNVMYYATTRDFHEFSEPKVFIDDAYPTIDTTIIENEGTLLPVDEIGSELQGLCGKSG
ncbi:hypothetical protein DNH61_17460 [Paenibacillus sambharensis]|uniref:non-reducing end alpha-L-arabinofuranosidase n=1 Tax=Paenibacillus sambharensis TaxID=1803190 RepID=A0A2W1L644_9BACL|nr:immunoglobulin-like domain-containing protein [Paenibacillus sambharensis]PZD94736.1 hypothetical protein DNH61_17460 [Paenibacillus sambharensis]